MKETPKISVITVAYNCLDNLKKTMQSVDKQDYNNLEYVIVDGGSSDGTAVYLNSYTGKLDSYVSEHDNGIYDAMNKGLALASGDYCIFMNAGDAFASYDVVSKIVGLLSNCDVVYGDIMKNGEIKKSLSPRNCHKMYYCHQAVFTKADCLREFPFDTKHRMSADFKQSKQLFLAGKSFMQTDVVVADYDSHGVSNTKRSLGILDNIRVIKEVDKISDRIRLLPRLYFTYLWCKIRGK